MGPPFDPLPKILKTRTEDVHYAIEVDRSSSRIKNPVNKILEVVTRTFRYQSQALLDLTCRCMKVKQTALLSLRSLLSKFVSHGIEHVLREMLAYLARGRSNDLEDCTSILFGMRGALSKGKIEDLEV